MPEEDIAKFVAAIEAALADIELSEPYQQKTESAVAVLESLLAYFKGITPAAGAAEPDVVVFAQEVAEGHSRNLSDYIRKLCRLADHDPTSAYRSYEYDSALYHKHFDRFPTLGDLGQRTFGRNNLGVMLLNLQVSSAFVEYFSILQNYPAGSEDLKDKLQSLDECFRDTEAYKAIVEFERGTGGLWVKQEFSFKAAAEDPKGFSGLGRWLA